MNTKSYICFLFIICISCASSRIVTINSGCFQYVEDDLTKTIVLKKDYQFTFIESFGRIDVKCTGEWIYISKDTILLQCKNEPLENAFVQGYMPTRNHKIKIISADKIKLLCNDNTKYKYFIFKRVESE